MECVFCKIVKGKILVTKVYEDDHVLAFLDAKPHAKGHTVVIPKVHGETIFDFNDEVLGKLIVAVKKVMLKIKDKLDPDSFNVGWNHNTAGGQVVPHLHVHVIPRYQGDGGGSMHSIVDYPQSSVEEIAEML